jgi:hypothetical protein
LDLTGGLSAVSVRVKTASTWFFLQGSTSSCRQKPAKLNADVSTTAQIGLVSQAQAFTYGFVEFPTSDSRHWLDEQKAGVVDAFDTWNSVSMTENFGRTFRQLSITEINDGVRPNFSLRKDTQRPNSDGFFSADPILPNRRSTGGAIFFNASDTRLYSRRGYYKTGLHEIGHAFGLAHVNATVTFPDGDDQNDKFLIPQATVMNRNGGVGPGAPVVQNRDDYRNFVPMTLSACDIEAVKRANLK